MGLRVTKISIQTSAYWTFKQVTLRAIIRHTSFHHQLSRTTDERQCIWASPSPTNWRIPICTWDRGVTSSITYTALNSYNSPLYKLEHKHGKPCTIARLWRSQNIQKLQKTWLQKLGDTSDLPGRQFKRRWRGTHSLIQSLDETLVKRRFTLC